MSKKVNKIKFFRPGSLEVPGTKISIKTMPYLIGVIFDTQYPITSFQVRKEQSRLWIDCCT